MERRIAVDTFFRTNRMWGTGLQYTDMNSLCQALDYDDFEAIYGIDDDENLTSPREKVYYLMNSHPERVIVIGHCNHSDLNKIRHHPDYSKPYEVELLCKHCHYQRHKKAIDKHFNFSFTKYNERKKAVVNARKSDNGVGEALNLIYKANELKANPA